jgi:proton-translocating NADH-quinone oxidoreductase chain N
MNTNLVLLFIFFPMLIAPLVYFVGRWRLINGGQMTHTCWLAVIALAATFVPYGLVAQEVLANGDLVFAIGSINLQVDGLSLLLAGVVLTLGIIVTVYSGPTVNGRIGQEKYYATLLVMISMIIGLGCSRDLFNLWLWFEGMAIASYLLVAFHHETRTALEAGVKYLVQSATGSVFVLMGIALVLGQTGQLDLVALHAADRTPLLLAAGAMFIVGFGVKIALVPLHTWLPDAHSQAPSGISAMLSGIVIEAGLVALLRSLTAVAGITPTWGTLFLFFGGLNMLAGNLLALQQKQVKRLLAYSSLSHIGYMLVGLGIALYSGEAAGAQGSFFHLLSHGLMKGLAFLAAGALMYVAAGAVDDHKPLLTSDLAGAAQKYPLIALTFSLALLGLAGIPPLAGFMSKWQIFAAGFDAHSNLTMGLVIFAALNSVLSLAYYAPLINTVYRREPSPAITHGRTLPFTMSLPLILLAAAVLLIGIWPTAVQWLTQPAGTALLSAFGG